MSAPTAGSGGHISVFVAIFCVILSIYDGGFATIPFYLSDLFGTQHVGAIHGRLLTAWSVAGILGPVIVNYIREFQLSHGVAADQAYSVTMYVLAGLLVIGFFRNLLVKPVHERHYMSAAQLAAEKTRAYDPSKAVPTGTPGQPVTESSSASLALAWAAVALPLGWALWITVNTAVTLMQ